MYQSLQMSLWSGCTAWGEGGRCPPEEMQHKQALVPAQNVWPRSHLTFTEFPLLLGAEGKVALSPLAHCFFIMSCKLQGKQTAFLSFRPMQSPSVATCTAQAGSFHPAITAAGSDFVTEPCCVSLERSALPISLFQGIGSLCHPLTSLSTNCSNSKMCI